MDLNCYITIINEIKYCIDVINVFIRLSWQFHRMYTYQNVKSMLYVFVIPIEQLIIH